MGGSILALPWMESLAAKPSAEVARRLAFYTSHRGGQAYLFPR